MQNPLHRFNQLTLSYYEHLRPANPAEASLVDLLVAAIWRGEQLLACESNLNAPNATLNKEFALTRDSYRTALAEIERLRNIAGSAAVAHPLTLAAPVPLLRTSVPPDPMEPLAADPCVTQNLLPILDSEQLLARSVKNPDARASAGTAWIRLNWPDGTTILNNRNNPLLWPVRVKPGDTPQSE